MSPWTSVLHLRAHLPCRLVAGVCLSGWCWLPLLCDLEPGPSCSPGWPHAAARRRKPSRPAGSFGTLGGSRTRQWKKASHKLRLFFFAIPEVGRSGEVGWRSGPGATTARGSRTRGLEGYLPTVQMGMVTAVAPMTLGAGDGWSLASLCVSGTAPGQEESLAQAGHMLPAAAQEPGSPCLATCLTAGGYRQCEGPVPWGQP